MTPGIAVTLNDARALGLDWSRQFVPLDVFTAGSGTPRGPSYSNHGGIADEQRGSIGTPGSSR